MNRSSSLPISSPIPMTSARTSSSASMTTTTTAAANKTLPTPSPTTTRKQTYCHRYLSKFAGITADTIDCLVSNGIDSVHSLRALNMDRYWHRLPQQLSIGQKLLISQALDKLNGGDDDDIDDNNDWTEPSTENNGTVAGDDDQQDSWPSVVTTSPDTLKANKNYQPMSRLLSPPMAEASSATVAVLATDDSEADKFPTIGRQDFDLRDLQLQTQPIVAINRLKMPIKNVKSKASSNESSSPPSSSLSSVATTRISKTKKTKNNNKKKKNLKTKPSKFSQIMRSAVKSLATRSQTSCTSITPSVSIDSADELMDTNQLADSMAATAAKNNAKTKSVAKIKWKPKLTPKKLKSKSPKLKSKSPKSSLLITKKKYKKKTNKKKMTTQKKKKNFNNDEEDDDIGVTKDGQQNQTNTDCLTTTTTTDCPSDIPVVCLTLTGTSIIESKDDNPVDDDDDDEDNNQQLCTVCYNSREVKLINGCVICNPCHLFLKRHLRKAKHFQCLTDRHDCHIDHRLGPIRCQSCRYRKCLQLGYQPPTSIVRQLPDNANNNTDDVTNDTETTAAADSLETETTGDNVNDDEDEDEDIVEVDDVYQSAGLSLVPYYASVTCGRTPPDSPLQRPPLPPPQPMPANIELNNNCPAVEMRQKRPKKLNIRYSPDL
ncbi:uncharacterized protein LOC128955150 [Oppia nitens]|uniref:uncharacterized protein LOC128955150 n=1 Tax=Oppia nitens TaxID=1686743 RepID=UPI0023D9C487|nr:uncharacterized protein LOC128955150 [Oppia nitens]